MGVVAGGGPGLPVGGQADGEAQVPGQRPHRRTADGQLAAGEDEAGRPAGIGAQLGPVEARHPVLGRRRVGGGLHEEVDVPPAGRGAAGQRGGGVLGRQTEEGHETPVGRRRGEDQVLAAGNRGAGPERLQAQHDILSGPLGRDPAPEAEPGRAPPGPPGVAHGERLVGPGRCLGRRDRLAGDVVGRDGQGHARAEHGRLDHRLGQGPRPAAHLVVGGLTAGHRPGPVGHDLLLVSWAQSTGKFAAAPADSRRR